MIAKPNGVIAPVITRLVRVAADVTLGAMLSMRAFELAASI